MKTGTIWAVVILALLNLTSVGYGQSRPDDFTARAETWRLTVEQLSEKVADPSTTDKEFSRLRRDLELLNAAIIAASTFQIERLKQVRTDLETLGKSASEGSLKDDPSAIERQRLKEAETRIEANIRKSDLTRLSIRRLLDQISEKRRTQFTQELLSRTATPLSLSLWVEGWTNVAEVAASFQQQMSQWYRFAVAPEPARLFLALIAAFGAIGALIYLNRTYVLRLLIGPTGNATPGKLRRSSHAFWMALVPTLSAFFGAWLVLAIFEQFALLRPGVDAVFWSFLIAIAGIVSMSFVTTAILSPKRPAWRISPVGDVVALRLRKLAMLGTCLYAVHFIGIETIRALAGPYSLLVLMTAMTTLAVAAILTAMLHRPVARQKTGAPDYPSPPWVRGLRALSAAAAISLLVSSLLGYNGVAGFILSQIFVSTTILSIALLAFLFAQDVSSPETVKGSYFERNLNKWFEITPDNTQQIGLFSGMVFNFLILAVGVPLVLLQWGFRSEEIGGWFYSLLSGFRIGAVNVSPGTILSGVFVFLLGLVITRTVKRWLHERFISRMRIDPGLKNSINTTIGYFGFVVSVVMAVTYAGVDLSNFALIAGALSVGIGFGLQNIVNNFVSGLILLFERPIKTGDWITVGSQSGVVRRIGVRATVLETLNKQSIVVPNAELINTPVANWNFGSDSGRVSIAVGVSYEADEKHVRHVLLDVARQNSEVVDFPAADVILTDFGASSLNFELRVHLRDIGRRIPVASELRFAIREAFRRENIDIPFPQQDIRIVRTTPKPA